MLVALGPAISSSEHIYILDVGCGYGEDAIPLTSYFGKEEYDFPGENVTYWGINIEDSEITDARNFHKNREDLQFEIADATNFDNYPFLRKKFDVIVFRHPELYPKYGPDYVHPAWFKMFKEARDHLAPDGIILVTTYSCNEHAGTQIAMECLGAITQISSKNPFAGKNKHYMGWFRDKYVAVYRFDRFDDL